MLRFTIGLVLATAALASLGFAHAQPTDDSLRIYAVDIWQDPPQSWGPGRGVYLGKGLVLTAAHVVGSVAQTKPRVHIAGMELPATPIREGNVERVDLTLLSVDEQKLPVCVTTSRGLGNRSSSRHRRSAPSYQLSIAFRGDVILPRYNGGQTCLGHFSWHICHAAVDACRRRRKAGHAVSAVLDCDACEQRGLLWASRRSILTRTF